MIKNWDEMSRDERQAMVDACWVMEDTRVPLPENYTDKEFNEDAVFLTQAERSAV